MPPSHMPSLHEKGARLPDWLPDWSEYLLRTKKSQDGTMGRHVMSTLQLSLGPAASSAGKLT